MADNFGRMQLADYLVSYALQTLNRCLLKLGSAETLSVKDQRLLLEQISHLQSLWQLMQRSVGKVEREAATARLREARAMLAGAEPALLAGRQLLEIAEGRVRAVLEDVLDGYALQEEVAALLPERRDRLSTLLQAESACWRDYPALRQVSEPALIEHGMGRAYAKARRLTLRVDAADETGRAAPSPKRLSRTHGWVGKEEPVAVATRQVDRGVAPGLGRFGGGALAGLDEGVVRGGQAQLRQSLLAGFQHPVQGGQVFALLDGTLRPLQDLLHRVVRQGLEPQLLDLAKLLLVRVGGVVLVVVVEAEQGEHLVDGFDVGLAGAAALLTLPRRCR